MKNLTKRGEFIYAKKKKYSPEFKLTVILDIRENHLGYREAQRKYNLGDHGIIAKWERILDCQPKLGQFFFGQ